MATPIGFEVKLKESYDQALEKLTLALKAEGFGILTHIDVQKTFKEKLNADFRRYAILGVCNPPLAKRALTRNAQAGLLLPCTATLEENETGGSLVCIADPQVMLNVGDLGSDEELQSVAQEARSRLLRVAQELSK